MTRRRAAGGSFRDPSGRVFVGETVVHRTVMPVAAGDYEHVRDSGLLATLVKAGKLVASREIDPAEAELDGEGARYVLEHPRLDFVSHPYEWPFRALQAAAVFHLDVQLEALSYDAALSDASAYNIQFDGPRPVFIDHLSFRRYREGELWAGHRQFCEQFLNPLLLRALCGVAPNAWYRGALEGIAVTDLARLIPWRKKLGWNVLLHVVLQSRFQSRAGDAARAVSSSTSGRRALPRPGFEHMLRSLRRWIARLEPGDARPTTWRDYAETHGYEAAEMDAKLGFVREYAKTVRPRLAYDLGCNVGDFAACLLDEGAGRVVGFDADHGALDAAFARAREEGRRFLPLYQDLANPSPDQGWRQGERSGFDARPRADGVLALALVHHLAIGRNLPLEEVVSWITGLARSGVVEFVPKEDPQVQRLLALREDVFPGYTREAFEEALRRRARVVRTAEVTESERCLFWFETG